MKRPHRYVKRAGFRLDEREAPQKRRVCQHGFVPAEEHLRQQPLTAPLADIAAWHALESKRPVRCIADMIGAHQLTRDGLNPILRKRQEMPCIL